MALTPPEIQHRALKSRGRGYERRSVDDLLEEITESFDQVWRERDQLRARVDELEQLTSVFRESERVVHETLLAAQRVAESLRDEAKAEAESSVAEARRFAEHIVADATSDAARREAEIRRLETLERDLQARLKSFLTAGLQLVQDEGNDQAPRATLPEHLREAAKAQAGELS